MPYFVSPLGDDANSGITELSPFRNLARVSQLRPSPGDTVHLRGGAIFPGLIDWFWQGVGDGSRPITVRSYGTGIADIVSPLDQPGFFYAGLGGIKLMDLRFIGNCTDPMIGGIVMEPANGGCNNISLENVETSGYGLGGAVIKNASDVKVNRSRFHHCVNGLFLSQVISASITHTHGNENDYLGPLRTDLQAANGFSIHGSRNVRVWKSQANRNGLRTTGSGGHAGGFFSNCDWCQFHRCEFHGNGDATGQDGQGGCLYGCRDCEIADYCIATKNLNAGFCLFHDRHTEIVERCEIRDSVATGSLCDLSIVGTVVDSAIHGNRIYSARHKTLDIADHEEGTYYRRNLKVFGNDFHARPGDFLLVAVPGLRGVEGLEANGWYSSEMEPFLVRGLGYDKIEEALAAEPVGV